MKKFLGRRVAASLVFQVGCLVGGAGLTLAASGPALSPTEDPWLWLEAIDDPRALAWVKQHNDATERRLRAGPEHDTLFGEALAVLDSASRVPEVTQRGSYLYNLWQDREHPRGLYRRTTPEEFRKAAPKWETVLDVDALAKTEGKPWAFGGASWLPPENRRCLIRLAPGGGDAVEVWVARRGEKGVCGGGVLPAHGEVTSGLAG